LEKLARKATVIKLYIKKWQLRYWSFAPEKGTERKQRNRREEKEGFFFFGDSKFPIVQILSSIFQFCFRG